jgi:hypothetical protein
MASKFGELRRASSSHGQSVYRAPRLIAFGPLNTLTRAGTGNAQETDICNPPGCNPDMSKRRP